MQGARSPEPTIPPNPRPSQEQAVPAPAKSTAIPDQIANDPGLAPGVRVPAAPQPGTLAQPEGRSTEFVPVQGGKDTASAEALLVGAYIVMWALLMLFVWFTWRRQQRIENRMGQLEKQIEAAEGREA